MARKIRFQFESIDIAVEGDLDRRGRRGQAGVPVHFRAVRVDVRIDTAEPEPRLERLQALVGRFCPMDILFAAAVADYTVTWRRVPRETTE